MAKKTEQYTEQATTRKVRLSRPGVVSCGPYRSGEGYEVPAEEARRLVEVKGFTYAEE